MSFSLSPSEMLCFSSISSWQLCFWVDNNVREVDTFSILLNHKQSKIKTRGIKCLCCLKLCRKPKQQQTNFTFLSAEFHEFNLFSIVFCTTDLLRDNNRELFPDSAPSTPPTPQKKDKFTSTQIHPHTPAQTERQAGRQAGR